MNPQIPPLETIEDFLAHKRLAIVGLSRNPRDFSGAVFRELTAAGYDLVPVNPSTPEALGRKCFARVQEIDPPVEGALLMTSPEVTETVVEDCVAAGIPRVWMHRGGGSGAVSPKAVTFCQEHGIRVVPGQCPLMFLPHSAGVHRFHGFLRKLFGRYPKRSPKH